MKNNEKQNFKAFLSLFLVIGTISVVAMPALAENVCHNFTGTVTFVSGTPFGLSPTSGDSVEGNFTYDTSLPPAYDDGSVAGYIQPAPSGMSVTISGFTLQSTGDASYQMLDNAYGVDNLNGFFGVSEGSTSLYLADTSQTVFSSTALPPSLPIDDFQTKFNSRFGSVSQGSAQINFSIDALTPCAIAIAVKIDIKPGSFPNSINPKSNGKIAVAILTTDATSDNSITFDATTVDPATVLFGATGTEAAPVQYALKDADRDGDTDLILHFNTQNTGIGCGDNFATLSGETSDGKEFTGTDSIRTVGCKK